VKSVPVMVPARGDLGAGRIAVGSHILALRRTGAQVRDHLVARHLDGAMDTVYYHGQAKWNTAVLCRGLRPKGVEGMRMAGRCFSGNDEGVGGCRGMGIMVDMGQAAGVAAALAVKGNVAPRRVNAKDVRAALAEMGVRR